MIGPALVDVDLFSGGGGGWCHGARALGLDPIGFEMDADACATRAAAGLRTVRADVSQVATAPLAGRIRLLAGSPPCQAFSSAGKGGGKTDLPLVWQAMADLERGHDTRGELRERCVDPRSLLIVEPLRFVLDCRPRMVALEQVPPCLAVWQAYRVALIRLGYSVWCGVLNAADYGVPQTRRRAILMASLDGPVGPPAATHCRGGDDGGIFGPGAALEPWVSMAQALGFGMTSRPAFTLAPGGGGNVDQVNRNGWTAHAIEKEMAAGRWTVRSSFGQPSGERSGTHEFDPGQRPAHAVTTKARSWRLRNNTQDNAATRGLDEPAPTMFFGGRLNDVSWVKERPATTVCGDSRIGRPGHKDRDKGEAQFAQDSVRITIDQAAILQSFPAGYPWQGSKTARFRQVGDAFPPLVAMHVLSRLTGATVLDGAA